MNDERWIPGSVWNGLRPCPTGPGLTDLFDFGHNLFGLEVSQTDGTRGTGSVAGSASLAERFVNGHYLSVRIHLQGPEFTDLFTETATRAEGDIDNRSDRLDLNSSCKEGDGCP